MDFWVLYHCLLCSDTVRHPLAGDNVGEAGWNRNLLGAARYMAEKSYFHLRSHYCFSGETSLGMLEYIGISVKGGYDSSYDV